VDREIAGRLEETTRLGSYEILRKLARGGMAELFLAVGPDGLVVVKKILPKYADSTRFTQLFLDEAKLAASLDHPNIVRAHGAGQDRGTTFFAMELVHGPDTRSILHRAWTVGEQMPTAHAVFIAARVADALHYAHEQRRPDGTLLEIVHRDVSPSNIVVSYDGEVKLLDFGVAKAATSTVKTRTGTLKGKISYMSPEQAKGSKLDRRSDIFSLGIVLWEMVTTQRLFRGENDLQTLQLIINEPPRRPSELQPACTPELERIILRALARDLSARYQTAAELLADLEQVARAESLAIGPGPLAGYLAELFSPEVRSWREAQSRGRTLLQHLTSGGELTIQLTESDFVEAIDLDAMIAEEEEDDPSEHTDLPTGAELGELAPVAGWVGSPSAAVRRPVTPPAQPAPHEPHLGGARPATPPTGRNPTPPAALPVVPGQAAAGVVPRTATPVFPLPIVPGAPDVPPPVAADDPAAAGLAGPWHMASGSSGSTPGSASMPAVSTPGSASMQAQASVPGSGDFVLDPELADRLLRQGLWVGAAILAAVVLFSIVVSLVS
jgi:serine/threonine protein kinase